MIPAGVRVPKLNPELLVSAYAQGIFPMGVAGRIRWFSPDPRAILPLESFHASRTLLATVRRGAFEIRFNATFADVMRHCADRDEGSWITPSILRVYGELHEAGLAHSVEAWRGGVLAGGLYGVALGGAFFGESMFHRVRDASKVALVALIGRLRERGFTLLDVQWSTDHLRRFGSVEIPRDEYLCLLAKALERNCRFS
jgi:leucyl/phenylalanyl-tRNA---protein transferase